MSNCTPKWPVASFLCHTVRSDQKIKEKKQKRNKKSISNPKKTASESVRAIRWIACLYGCLGIYVISRPCDIKRQTIGTVYSSSETWDPLLFSGHRQCCVMRAALDATYCSRTSSISGNTPLWVWRQSSFWRYATTRSRLIWTAYFDFD